MTYTKKQFLEDVKKEAVALRKLATERELGRLNFENLHPNHTKTCVYGQLTGDCDSQRATELIKNCAPIYFRHDRDLQYEPTSEFREFYWSPIERYLYEPDAKNKNLIDFLKGNRKDLVL